MNHQGTKTQREPIPPETERVGKAVVDAAYKVHSHLGPGLLESVYEACMVHELSKHGLKVERQVPVPIEYDGLILESALRLDLRVEDCGIVELKSTDTIIPVYEAQILSHLKLMHLRLGYLINFNVVLIRDGIKRIAL